MAVSSDRKYNRGLNSWGQAGQDRGTVRRKNLKDRRVNILFYLVTLLGLLIVFRLFNLQIIGYSFYSALAYGQHGIFEQLFARRGQILINDAGPKNNGNNNSGFYPLATNKEFNLIYAVPKEIIDPKRAARILVPLIGLAEEDLLAKFSKKDDYYEPLKHKVSDDDVLTIKKLNLKGIEISKEVYRYYPENNIASQLVGFVGFKGNRQVGQYGLEGYFDKELSGQAGYLKSEKDPTGSLISFADRDLRPAQNGSDLILTIDRSIEFFACSKIKEAVEKYEADDGSVIIMDPKTGAIVALCNYPDFNPNNYSQVKDLSVFNNSAVFAPYEPGSVFKAITMAAGLDAGEINPDSTYFDTGSVKFGKYTIKNSDLKAYGLSTMTQVLDKSLNTGAIFVEEKVGNDLFQKYVSDFGFGSLTGIELDTEVAGDISSLSRKGDIYGATSSFGQGITATPIQLITAYAAIANGGNLMKPYIVDQIVKADGTIIKTKPKIVRRAISDRTATLLTGMLVSVVQNGHGKRAGVPGYYVAGKTGTAQVRNKNGPGYDPNLTVGSFIGFAPADDPKFVMLIKINHPRDVEWAESSAAPVFGDLSKFLLNYYQIPPYR